MMSDRRTFAERLKKSELADLRARGSAYTYRSGAHLMRQGEDGDCVILLEKGFVTVTSSDRTGSTRLLGVRRAGELLGEMACIDGRPRSASVVAKGCASGVKIARSRFLDFLDGRPRVAREVTRQVSWRLRASEAYQLTLMSAPVGERVLMVLAELVEQLAEKPGKVKLPFNQREISQLAAVSLASTQRWVWTLRDREFIDPGYGKIEVPCAGCLRRVASLGEIGLKSSWGCRGKGSGCSG